MTPEAPIPVPGHAPWLDAWRSLVSAGSERPLAQAATVSASGEPEVRTVVLRGLSYDGCPYFTTDLRSDKIGAIRAGSQVELCIWWADPGIQVRLRGAATPIAETTGAWGSVRESVWRNHRETERRGFAGPPPGTRLDEGSAAEPDRAPAFDGPHPNFALVVVTPTRYDRLELGDPHLRHVFEWIAGSGWQGGRVTP